MKDGGLNTKLFHRVVNGRRNFFFLIRIKVDNQVFGKDSTLKGANLPLFNTMGIFTIKAILLDISWMGSLTIMWALMMR